MPAVAACPSAAGGAGRAPRAGPDRPRGRAAGRAHRGPPCGRGGNRAGRARPSTGRPPGATGARRRGPAGPGPSPASAGHGRTRIAAPPARSTTSGTLRRRAKRTTPLTVAFGPWASSSPRTRGTSTTWRRRTTPSGRRGSRRCSQGAHQTPVADALVPLEPRPATRDELERVHPAEYLDAARAHLRRRRAAAGSTPTPGPAQASWEACRARRGRGAARRSRRSTAGEGDAAFCAVRPPGHHATADRVDGLLPGQQRGRHRRRAGRPGRAGADRRLRRPPRQRHPGHLLRATRRVLYVSLPPVAAVPGHRARSTRRATAPAAGTTLNIPAAAGRDRRRLPGRRSTTVVAPLAEVFEPTWLLVSAGFDAPPARPAHRPRARPRATTR